MSRAPLLIAGAAGLLIGVVAFPLWCNAPAEAQPSPQAVEVAAPSDAQRIRNILQLQGKEFFRAVDTFLFDYQIGKANPTLQDLWVLMDRLEHDRKQQEPEQNEGRNNIERIITYGRLVEIISTAGGEQDHVRLLRIYDGLPGDSWLHQQFIEPLTEYQIKREIAALEKGKKPLAAIPIKTDIVLPKELETVSPELHRAWKHYKSVSADFEAQAKPRTSQDKNWVSAEQNWPTLYTAVSEVLHGRTAPALAKLGQLEWGNWCGTGSGTFYGPKLRATFLALLKEHRYPLALGGLFSLMEQRGLSWRVQDDADWQRRFIGLCGQDWEVLYAGAAVDMPYGRYQPLHYLAQHGSAQAARLVNAMSGVPGMTDRDDYLRAVSAFITSTELATDYGTASSADIKRIANDRIPDNLQRQLLQILHEKVRPDAGLQTMDTVSHILVTLCRPESKPAFHTALKLPFGKVRERAALALKALGEEVPDMPKTGPAQFRLVMNGKPLANTRVAWELRETDSPRISSSAQTDANGVIQLNRDYLLDPQHKITKIVLASEKLKSPDDMWFQIAVSPPADLEAVQDVATTTTGLTIKLTPDQPGQFAGQSMRVRLKVERTQPWGKMFEVVSDDMTQTAGSDVVFPHLQAGSYQVEIFAPGKARWESESISLEKVPATAKAVLQKGADLKFEIVAPGGEKRAKNVGYDLLLDGKALATYTYYDYRDQIFHGLPQGNYTLRIHSSAEQKKLRRTGEISTAPEFLGEERKFTIDENSPAFINLGEIQLKPAPQL